MKRILLISLLNLLFLGLFAQELEWAISQGGVSSDKGNNITIDIDQNVLICGVYFDTVDFDPSDTVYNIVSTDGFDCFIQKLDPNGNLIWVKSIDTYFGKPSSITTDLYGNVYVIGDFTGTVDFDPGPSVSTLSSEDDESVFILKLNSDGDFQWVNSFYNGGSYFVSIINDSFGNVYAIGEFSGTVDFDPSSSVYNLESSENSVDMFILKLDSNGEFQWAKQTDATPIPNSSTEAVYGKSIIIGNDNYIYITGFYYGTIDFDPGVSVASMAATNNNAFILKLDLDGEFVWVKQIECSGGALSQSINSDNNGNIYIIGYFDGFTDFDPGPLETILTSNTRDLFIEKLDSDGNFLWVKQIGGNQDSDHGFSITTDEFGFSYSTGFFKGLVDFDPGIGVSYIQGVIDIFVLKLGPNGEFIWVKDFGGNEFGHGHMGLSIEVDNENNIYTTGFFSDTVDFDPGNDTLSLVTKTLQPDIFIQKLSQDTCSWFAISVDSIIDILCGSSGLISTHGIGGAEPYSYSWNTTPIQIEPTIICEDYGVYTITISDAIGCEKSYSTVMQGPDLNGYDMDANLVSPEFIPGFLSHSYINAYNNGCISTDGTITLVLDSLVSLDSAVTQPDIIIGDSLIWNYQEMNFDSNNVELYLSLLTSDQAVIGDTVCFDLIITPFINDIDTTNNHKHYCFPVINGYDPNDIKVYPQGRCEDHFTLKNEALTYTIRFQNTGNAEAINIHILDTLSSHLDINTIEVIGSSHDMYTQIHNGNVVEFIFNEILLPDSSSNEPESHGYVIFKVHPKSSLVNGTYVENKSEIYFDFNPAIVTNTVFNTLVNAIPLCSSDPYGKELSVVVYPNPSNGIINIDLGAIKEISIRLYNISGQLIYNKESVIGAVYQFQIDEPAGIYILEISSESDKKYIKIVKE